MTAGGLFTTGKEVGTFMVIAACGCGSSDTSAVLVTAPAPVPVVTSFVVTPGAVALALGASQQFSVAVSWSDNASHPYLTTYSTNGGIVSSNGLYSAPSTPGTFIVVATCNCGFADTSVVTVLGGGSPPPPPPPPSPSGGNEPPGYVRFGEMGCGSVPTDFTRTWKMMTGVIAGNWWMYGRNFGTAQDSLAPKSPSATCQIKYPAGLPAGVSPAAQFWMEFGGSHYSEVYESGWFRLGDNNGFETQMIGVKIWGYWSVGDPSKTDQLYMVLDGNGVGTAVMTDWKIWFAQQSVTASRRLSQNIVSTSPVHAGRWQRYEMVMKLNTIGVADGVLRVWVDGVKVLEHRDVVWRNAAYPRGFFGKKVDPVWGGQGGAAKSRDDYLYFDHIYMSGIQLP